MNNKAFLVFFAALLMSFSGPVMVSADESTLVSGKIDVGVRTTNDAEDSAQYQEFRTMDSAGFGNIHLNVAKPDHYLQFEAEIADSDDLSFILNGGKYGFYKYQFNYNKMQHNYYFDARTPASGVGSDFLDFPLVADVPPLAQWDKFDYSVDHKSYGAALELSFNTPYFINIAVERREQDGKRPYSTRQFAEIPEPVDTTTDNLSAKLGYAGDNISASVTGSISQFDNDNKFIRWSDPNNGSITEIVLSPDNDFTKLAGDLTWRNLPLNSVLAASASTSWLEGDYDMNDVGFTDTGSYNRTDFDGDIKYKTVSLSLLSRPMPKLNTRIYYRYIDRDNDSSVIDYGTTNAEELLSYEKDVLGINLGYQLPGKNKLDVGYEYLNTDRSTPEGDGLPADETEDNTIFVQLKNKYFDWMVAKLRYTYMDRDSSDVYWDTVGNPTAFYYLDQESDEIKLALEFYPLEQLDLGLDFSYEKIDYDSAVDTRQDEKSYSTYLDAAWRASDTLTLRGFAGFEKIKIEANRVTADDPSPIYGQDTKEDFWIYGLGMDYQATSKLRFDLAWQYQNADGSVDFDNSVTGTSYVDIDDSDDYTKKQLDAKAIYALTDAIDVTLAYIYEKFEYDDRNYEGYPSDYIIGGDNYLSGFYSDQDYEINAAYLTLSYTF